MVEFVDDVARVLAAVFFLWVWIRFGTSTRWWLFWDTRALFILFTVLFLVVFYSVMIGLWPPGSDQRVIVAAVVWVIVAGAAGFLAVGYEVEQRRARRQDDAEHCAELNQGAE